MVNADTCIPKDFLLCANQQCRADEPEDAAVRCVDPFRRWIASYDGQALDTTVDDQWNGSVDRSRTVDVELHLEMEMAVPPWIQGTMGEAAKELMTSDSVEAAFMGGWRFEQLFRGTGSFHTSSPC